MAKLKRLLDIFRFPGFVPRPKVRGVFGDPRAVVITLQRRRKKRSAGSVDRSFVPTTTSDHAASAICLVATSVSISPSRFAGSSVSGVAA
jgi:hypothetical protein